jgi:hypothetical protein
MPEILEERFARAKSGLMLAPANTQAVSRLSTVVAMCSEILAYNKVNKHEFSGKEDV